MRDVIARAEGTVLGEALIQIREAGIDPLEATFAEGLRRFDESGEYAEDGALNAVAWLRWKCKLSAGAAAERLTVARHVDQLPKTEQAFARGELSYQHVAVMARTAEHVGVESVRKAEGSLLKAAETRDPGQLVAVAKDFEHRVDPGAALAEANRAYERRYLHLGEPVDGLVRLDGLLDTEGGAIIRRALNVGMLPDKEDTRTAGQRRADRLVEICSAKTGLKTADGSTSRPHLVIRTTVETLTRTAGSPAGEIEDGGTIPAETVRRLGCDARISRIAARGELEGEIGRASRTISPARRRALEARDKHCVFGGCDKPPIWCDGHHLKFWADGGPTTLNNLALLCRQHHRKVHEEGFSLQRVDGRFVVRSPDTRCRSS
ncbi:MAG TPA: DUF222 domain-containing protein [Candidatus Dormibacteraeota bacterium]